MDNLMQEFVESLRASVAALVYSDGGEGQEEKFTEHSLEILEGIEETEGPQKCLYIHPTTQGGVDWKINAYCLKDESKNEKKQTVFETIDIFVTYFDAENYGYTLTKDEVSKLINQFKRFLNSAMKGHIDYIDPSQKDLNQFLKILYRQAGETDRINFCILTNGICNTNPETIVVKGFEEIGINVNIWDLNRFYKLYHSASTHEPIEIDFNTFSEGQYKGIECLMAPVIDEDYQCFLAIMPGKVLSKLYKEYSSRLLESNVRAFLQQNGKINKGIRDTIRNPEKHPMFLPYNNGLSATAESVIQKQIDGKSYITKITDFQIVNGGQTTASLFHTEKKFKSDLSNIYIQMKLTVIRDVEKKRAEVPNISRFANSQNKISELDLSSNNPFFIKLEELSRKKYVINPQNTNQQILWFFERAAGQYKESLNKLSASQQKAFKEKNPSEYKFAKSDVAKFINLWDQEPNIVSQGSQKNFVYYTKKITEAVKKGELPGESFYKKLIASAILFKTVDKLFGRKNLDAIGDTNLKSFTTAYTISWFHYITDNRIDTWKIYNEQKIDSRLTDVLRSMMIIVLNHLQQQSANTLLSEYAKRESSWETLKKVSFKIDLIVLKDLLVTNETRDDRETEAGNEKDEDEILMISRILLLGSRFWDGLVIASKDSPLLSEIEFDIWEIAVSFKEDRNLNSSSFRIAKRIIALIDSHNIDPEEISAKSKLPVTIPFDYKAVFDRMAVLSKRDWESAYALAQKKRIFNNLELANFKTVFGQVLNKERVRENSLKKAHDSLIKLKKFNFKY